jgi:protease I
VSEPVSNNKIGIIVENKFIPDEIAAYQSAFPVLGYEVEFISRIWYGSWKPDSVTFYSDVDPTDSQPWESPQPLTVKRDISQVKPSDYAAIIMSANYTSVRLRWYDPSDHFPYDAPQPFNPQAYVKKAPVVSFFADAMQDRTIVKGALCHGLWILTANPQLLKDRTVTCHAVVMADVLNCGANVVINPLVVTDDDLVTGFSKHEVLPFIKAIAERVVAKKNHALAAQAVSE